VNPFAARAGAAVASCILVAAVLSACSAGQQSQTAAMQPAVDGVMADINNVALRNVRIRAEPTGYAVPAGRDVELALEACNQSPVNADALVAITSGIGRVDLVGNSAIPAGGKLIVDSAVGVQVRALASVEAVNAATATLKLSKPISHGLTYDFTFEFARAGTVTMEVPVVSPASDGSMTSPPAAVHR
jgi:hypothetical protein